MRFSLDKHLPYWFGLIGVVLGLLALIASACLIGLVNASAWVEHTYEVRLGLEQFLSALKDAETGVRGYLLTSQDAFLDPYRAALPAIAAAQDRLRLLTRDDAAQQRQLEDLRRLTAAKLAMMAENIAACRRGDREAALRRVRTGRGRQAMEAIRALAARIGTTEDQLLRRRQAAERRTIRNTITSAVMLTMTMTGVIATMYVLITREVAKRWRSGEELRRQTVVLRSILDNIGDAVIVADSGSGHIISNPAAAQMFGIDPGGMTIAEWLRHPVRPLADEAGACSPEEKPLALALHGQRFDDLERFVRPQGSPEGLWYLVSGRPLTGQGGVVQGAVCVFRDITARRRAERALRDSERRFRALFDQTFQYISLLSPDGTVLEVNRTALDFGGLRREDVVGRPFWEARWWTLSPEVQRRLRASIAEAASGRLVRYEVDVRGVGDRVATIDFSLKPLHDEAGRVVLLIPEGRDITDRKRVEQELRRQAAALREQAQLLDLAHDTIMVRGLEGTITFWNRGAEQMYGWSRDEALGQISHTLLKTRFPIPLDELKAELSRTGHWEGELIHRRRDGTPVVVASRWALQRDEQGRPQAALEINTDITGRKQAEEALRRQTEILRSILANMADAVIAADEHEHLLVSNPAAERLFGAGAAHTTSRQWPEQYGLYLPDMVTPYPGDQLPLARAIRGEAVADAELFVRNDRSPEGRWVLAAGNPLRDECGAVRGGIVVGRDITERKQNERRLRASEAKFRALLEYAPDAIVIVDREGRIVLANAQVARTFGHPAEELLGRAIEVLVPDERLPVHVGHRTRYFAGPRPLLGLDLLGRRRDGGTFPVEVSLGPLETEEGPVVVGIVRDTTERKRAEQELAARARELARSNAELEQFAYIASHDLQEPLRMVASFTQLLARRYKGRLDADADEFIGYAVDGANRMQAMINDLLEYSRVDRRGRPPAPTDLDTVLDHVLENLRPTIAEAGATVTRDPLPTAPADDVQLGRLFQNLIGNALKFRGAAPPRVHVGAERAGAEWIISVRDNGIGIDPKYFDRIFILFQRLHGRGQYPGTGIGLAICKKIVERHGGRIWVESEPGRGACFRFTLPVPEKDHG
jgi:PAS domain S-box-containing protein